jgi:hypothetical protein
VALAVNIDQNGVSVYLRSSAKLQAVTPQHPQGLGERRDREDV